jgi:hypothetical protein
MIKYAKITNQETGLCEVGLGTNTSFYQSIGMEQLDVQQSDIDGNWYLSHMCPMKTDEEKELEEKERIAMLSLTRGDVFRGLLLARGITRLMLRGMIENNEQLTEVQKEMALIDFDEALNFYRGNALIDTVGLALGIEPAQLDCFFETNDYTCLLPKEEPVEEKPVEEE